MISGNINLELADLEKTIKKFTKKLDYYENELATASITEKFTVNEIIEECQNKLEELNGKKKNILRELIEEEDKVNPSQKNTINNQYNQKTLEVEKELSKFNFKSTVQVVEKIINKFNFNNGSALFLLQNSISMGGNYFSAKFREILRTKTKEGNFRHCLVEFKSVCPTEKIEFLNRFAKFFPTAALLESIEEYTNQIIETICESIPQSGYILFLEISGLEYMLEKEKIMPWFVKDFWHKLSTNLQKKLSFKGYRKVRIICLMKTDDIIPDNCLPSYIYYELAKFHSSEIKELTIESCSQDEIEDFLYTFGGFNDQEVKQMVKLIHNTSKGGNPDLVCRKLKQMLTTVN